MVSWADTSYHAECCLQSQKYRSGDNGEVAARDEYSVKLAQLAPRISAIMNFSVGR